MNVRERVKEVMALCAAAAGVIFIREDQDGERPVRPFMSYKIINVGRESIWCEVEATEDAGDQVRITKFRTFKPVVSLNVIGDNYAGAWDVAETVKNYLESEEGKEKCTAAECFPRSMTETMDRNYFLETENESRLGFDITFEAKIESVRYVEAADVTSIINSMSIGE